MALEAWWSKTPEQLVELRHSLSAGTPDAITVDRMLELHIAKQNAEGSAALVRTTDKLVNVTNRLGNATLVLGGMTLLLVIAAAYPIFKREEDVGQRIRRECEAIGRAAVEVAPGMMSEDHQNQLVLKCLVESASRGRR